jgi:copper oxidase (laccase) domain-containing protein
MQTLSLIPECTITISTIDDGSIISYEDVVGKHLVSPEKALYMPEHRHGTDVVTLTKENIDAPPAFGDIIVTKLSKVAIIHQFADCVPFLCIDRKKKLLCFRIWVGKG